MKKQQRYIVLSLYLLAIFLFFALDLHHFFTFDMLKAYRADLKQFVRENVLLAPLIYMALYAIVVTLSIPIGAFLTITGGFLFGVTWGTLYTVIGATIGATGIFLLAQASIGKPLREKAGPWLQRMSAGFQKQAFSYLLTLRLIPIFPFFAINLVPAILGMDLRKYILATGIGIIPVTYLYSNVGSGIGGIFDTGKDFEANDILSPQIIFGLIGLAVLSLLPVVYRKMRGKKTSY